LKVGPNYKPPPAPVAPHWIDALDKRVSSTEPDLATWWAVFNDPVLAHLITASYQQDLTLREAGFRILEARAQYGIAVGEFFPQTQTMNGRYTRSNVGPSVNSTWNLSFNLAWELDFWGRFRRAIEAAQDQLDASVFDYDEVLVTLLGDVATNYVQYRTDQERIRLLKEQVAIQENVLSFIVAQLKIGFRGVTDLDYGQAESNLKQSLAAIVQLEIDMRLVQNRLCTLLGIPVEDLDKYLNSNPDATIPVTPDSIVVGMPADLLRRRPDVRRAERLAAAQAEQIGIAEAQLYPAFTISGTLGWQASRLGNLLKPSSVNSNVGPSFTWDLLNYGRIVNNMRLQDATFRELVVTYQQTVLNADEEVEDGIVTFLKAQQRARLLAESVDAAYRALEVIIAQYENPTQAAGAGADFNRYAVIQQSLITQLDQWAQARGQIALGLIEVYRALGGGWQIRCRPDVLAGFGLTTPDGQPVRSLGTASTKPEDVQKPGAENLPTPVEPEPSDPHPLPPMGDQLPELPAPSLPGSAPTRLPPVTQ
jgi:NodT family efflux transporter outer membrane factor (OMF) lipoprotein